MHVHTQPSMLGASASLRVPPHRGQSCKAAMEHQRHNTDSQAVGRNLGCPGRVFDSRLRCMMPQHPNHLEMGEKRPLKQTQILKEMM